LEDLKITCESVDAQMTEPFEHLIIDGSTNTDISQWLTSNTQPNYRKWKIERDKGISDAFNKGIKHAQGSILHLLNSGDTYFDSSIINTALDFFLNNKAITWASGKIFMKRSEIWVHVGVPFDPNQLFKGMRSISHPTYFLRASVYDRVGFFSEKYKIAMDFDLLCRLKDEAYGFINQTLIRFDDKGVSTNNYLESLKENIKVYESHFGFSLLCRLWQFRLKLMYLVLKTWVGKFLFKVKIKFNK
jgi:GT2 family glycosyltransferase